MSYADLLGWTQSDGRSDRIEALALPYDPALQPRFALVFAGPHAGELLQMVTDALDDYFTRQVAAHQTGVEPHGPDSGAQRPD